MEIHSYWRRQLEVGSHVDWIYDFALPPLILYYVGLLAGHNDLELLHRTGVGRDINRSRYTLEQVAAAMKRPVARRLAAALRLRNTHPAFNGDWELLEGSDPRSDSGGDSELAMRWTRGEDIAELTVDLRARTYALTLVADGRTRKLTDLAELW